MNKSDVNSTNYLVTDGNDDSSSGLTSSIQALVIGYYFRLAGKSKRGALKNASATEPIDSRQDGFMYHAKPRTRTIGLPELHPLHECLVKYVDPVDAIGPI